jgi:RNA polymerase-interacting CarD/CdnL/TRCF family regulator
MRRCLSRFVQPRLHQRSHHPGRGGDPFKYAKVAKELGKIRAEEGLRPRDKANLAQSLALLKEEITYSLKKTSAQVEMLLEKALETWAKLSV